MKKVISVILIFVLLSFAGCKNSKNASDTSSVNLSSNSKEQTSSKAPQEQVVELTLENWQEYFDIVEKPKWEENAFGEVVNAKFLSTFLCLKEEYKNKFIAADFACEFSFDECVLGKLQLDIGSKSYKILEEPENFWSKTKDAKIQLDSSNTEEAILNSFIFIMENSSSFGIDRYAKFNQMTRIQGTIKYYS